MKLEYDSKYYYFVYGTDFVQEAIDHSLISRIDEPVSTRNANTLAKEIFKKGIKSLDKKFCCVMDMVPDADYKSLNYDEKYLVSKYLPDYLDNYSVEGKNVNFIFLVKIPKSFLNVHNIGLAVPMWRKGTNLIPDKRHMITYLDPNFIVGMYNRKKRVFNVNKINPENTFSPNGLLYSDPFGIDKDIIRISDIPTEEFIKESLKRDSFESYEDLKEYDKENHTFDGVLKHYNNDSIKGLIKTLIKEIL